VNDATAARTDGETRAPLAGYARREMIQLDALPPEVTRLKGRIGMMSAPGLFRSLREDLDDLRDEHDARLIVSLVTEEELGILGIDALVEQAEARGIETLRFAIVDQSVPKAPKELVAVVERILAAAGRGETVVIHCWAGLGRTGLVAASCLVARGFAPDEAIATVRRHRARTVENEDQVAYIGEFARVWEDTSKRSAVSGQPKPRPPTDG
jgi:protein-tyrosine phosphatase